MDYAGHDKHFHDNLVAVACYDGQSCVSGGGSYPPGHNDRFENNHCIITGCRSSVNRSDHHGRCQEQIGNFQCNGASQSALTISMLHSWTLRNNSYYTHDGMARLPCSNLTVAAASAGGSGVETGSKAFSLPSDAELVGMARRVLGMKTDDSAVRVTTQNWCDSSLRIRAEPVTFPPAAAATKARLNAMMQACGQELPRVAAWQVLPNSWHGHPARSI